MYRTIRKSGLRDEGGMGRTEVLRTEEGQGQPGRAPLAT